MQYSGMVYHIFNYRVQGCWYRDGDIYSDEQFDHIMSALEWRLPAGIQVTTTAFLAEIILHWTIR